MPSRLIDLRADVADDLRASRVARHEQHADGVFAGRRQREAELGRLPWRRTRAGSAPGCRRRRRRAGRRPTAPRCSRLQQDRERVLDDLLRLAALDVGDEADAAGILLERRIVKTLRCHTSPRKGEVDRRSGATRGRVGDAHARSGDGTAPHPHPLPACGEREHGERVVRSCRALMYRRAHALLASRGAVRRSCWAITRCRSTAVHQSYGYRARNDSGHRANWDSNAVLVEPAKFHAQIQA